MKEHPIHRDGGRRDQGEQPYQDARETLSEKDAEIQRNAPLPENEGSRPSEEEQTAAQEQAAERRFDKIARDGEESSS